MQNNRYLIALVTALGLIPVVLDTTIVTVALSTIRNELHTDVNTVQWIVTAFFLASAAVVAVGGYLANRFGRKRIFILGVMVFTIGSFLCAISPGIGWLVAFRVLQGIGGGILLPIGPALAFDAFPQQERARASAVVGVPVLLAPVFGPIVGGYLNDTFGWHSIFFVNLPVGIIAVAAALLVLPLDKPGKARRAPFDSIGLALSIIGVIAVIYALKLVTQTNPSTVTATNPSGDLYGWGYWLVWVLLGAGIVVLGICAFYELRISRDPALDLRQLGRRDFLMSTIFSWAITLIGFGLLVLLPLYLEYVRLPHLSALDTGLALVPLGLGTIVGTIVAAALYRAIGPRWVVFMATALSALSAWLLAQAIHPTAGHRGADARTRGPEKRGPRQGIVALSLDEAHLLIHRRSHHHDDPRRSHAQPCNRSCRPIAGAGSRFRSQSEQSECVGGTAGDRGANPRPGGNVGHPKHLLTDLLRLAWSHRTRAAAARAQAPGRHRTT